MKFKKVLLILSLVISAICVPWFLSSHILVIGWLGFFSLAYADIILLHMELSKHKAESKSAENEWDGQ